MSRIAVVGGGAAGIAASWFLAPVHDVTLIEAEPILGGHIRTLGGNVPGAVLPPGVRLDAGVIEFDRENFTAFHAFMRALGVETEDVPEGGATRLVRLDGTQLLSPSLVKVEHEELGERLADYRHLLSLMLRRRRFFARTEVDAPEALYRVEVGRFLDSSEHATWVKALLMYAYSTPFEEVDHLSAAIAVPMLRNFLYPVTWTRVVGGAWAYVERALETMAIEVLVRHPVASVHRAPDGVRLRFERGEERSFDAVVLATPAHRILPLLADATDDERRRFGAWHGATIESVVHDDFGMYARRGIHVPSEFDLFEQPSGDYGYNAYLNRLAGLPADHPRAYGLAFHMDPEIDPARILHRQRHDVSLYRTEALRHREEVKQHNGEARTYYAGAWLGDGLHEGAVRSALAVSALLGGRDLGSVERLNAGSGRR